MKYGMLSDAVRLDEGQIARIVAAVPGGAGNVQDIYPLSPLQEGMLFHRLLNEQCDTYVLSTLFELPSRAKADEFIHALQQVIDRHEILRSSIHWDQVPRPLHVVHRRAGLPVEEITLDPLREVSHQLQEWISPLRQTLDLRRAPVMALQIAADPCSPRWYAVLRVHHLLCDHQSLRILIAEALTCLEGQETCLPEPTPFRAYVECVLAETDDDAVEKFFRGKLAGLDESTAPFGILDAHGDGALILESRDELEGSLSRHIREQARRLDVSPARLFHAAWALVVAATSARDDVVFGTVLSAARQKVLRDRRTLGMSVNTLPLRVQLRGTTASELVSKTNRELLELLDHGQASLAIVQRCSPLASRAPLFTALLNYRRSAESQAEQAMGGVRVLARGEAWTNYPVALTVDDLGERFALLAQTDSRIEPQRIIAYMRTAIESLADALEQAPQTPALALAVVPHRERLQVVSEFNATRATHDCERLVHALFEAQVRRMPLAIAAVHEGRSLTYAELDAMADRLARHLRSRLTERDPLVGICVGRGFDMLVGVLATLKAGAAYVPLDPSYPISRLEHMLCDAAPSVVLTQSSVSIPEIARAKPIVLDGVADEVVENEAGDRRSAAHSGSTPESLVYVIYTSGSTGRPKGVAMCHRSMVNLIEWHRRSLPLGEGRRVLQFAALSFDVAFQEIFSTLCTGGTLVLLDEWVRRDVGALVEMLKRESVERLFLPPMMLQRLAEHCTAIGSVPTTIRDVIVAGEQLRITPEIVELFRSSDSMRLHNHYGPTETHVVTALTLPHDPRTWPALPSIGRPIANSRIYILDAQYRPVPIGVAGEIYISGANIARGYLHRPQLTAERFVSDPFSPDAQQRMYKTGDLGRWRADGTIEYLGRNDDQVKIRGFRIELGEIEAQLAMYPKVRDAAVVAREETPGDKRLVAYVTARDSSALDGDELRAHLKSALPEYMVPSVFIVLESLPLTSSGKLNRRALPAPSADAFAPLACTPPQTPMEHVIAGIWQEILQVARVGREDNFFDLGGHSLSAMQAISRLRTALGVEVAVKVLFDHPTLAELSAHLETSGASLDHSGFERSEADIELLERVVAMSEGEARALLDKFAPEGQP